MFAGMMPSRRSRLTCLPKTARGSALKSSCVGIVPMSKRSEAADSSQADHGARTRGCGQHVDVPDWQGVGERNGLADDLAEAGREYSDQGIPGHAGEVAAKEQEARGGGDHAEEAG